ncbi:MAG: hypothetical protein HC792_01385 [Acaryochloridaceae cyanobacterium CSU_5_19]|nr:hypothetical protein [Acaryochloridaceae cyanobacterium CSU_5_19]
MATVQGQLLDLEGNPSNWDATVTLETSDGFFVGIDEEPDLPGFQVQAVDGQFKASLRSSLDAGMVRLRASANQMEAFHQFQFATPIRPSGLLSGVVDIRFGRRGTNFMIVFANFCPRIVTIDMK